MCVGLPMRVTQTDGTVATVEGRGERRQISLLLVGPQAVGTPVLVHIDAAVRVLTEEEVPLLEQALDGLSAVLQGEAPDLYFADLIGRTPQLPPHLQRSAK
jgi:hydrogenase expression/formation protein HypC